ncbi:MAG: hypothetical protein ACI4ES_08200 [Roseburia sp.]
MNQIVAAVCDCDEAYVKRFALYVRNHHPEQIVLHTFTRLEPFMEGLLEERFQVVLLGGGFDEAKEGIRQYKIPILYLAEEVETDDESDSDFSEESLYGTHGEAKYRVAEEKGYQQERVKTILKYQSAENILHEIYRACEREEGCENEFNGHKGKIEWIGVCSPIQHEMQMPFSVTMASLLSEKKKVLYLNLMECAGFLELFHLEGERNLSDLLVKVRQNRLSAEGFWQLVSQNESLYYIPPVTNPENLYQLEKEGYINLFTFLEQQTDFEVVVLDIGSAIQGFFDILSYCDEVFSLMKSGPFPECRRGQFERAIQNSGHEKLLEKMQTIYLPYSASQVVPAMGLLEQFKWSELGDMARKYLFGAVAYDS